MADATHGGTRAKASLEQGRRRRRVWGVAAGFVVLAFFLVGRPVFHVARVMWREARLEVETVASGQLDDASRMNATAVTEVWEIPEDSDAAEAQLRQLLERARTQGLRVSIAGARHSMGGHTIYPGGIVIDMRPFHHIELDGANDILHVQSGAFWSQIIPYLDERGRSIEVMQSDHSFTVGGSISVNCHGWQYGRPPIASTVASFRLMKADGAVVSCSRSENEELFSLALGGYGLFGIILDVDLRVVRNERLRLEQSVVAVEGESGVFAGDGLGEPGVRMAYARLNIVPDQLFETAIVNRLFPAPDGEMPALVDPGSLRLRRALFRGSAGSDYGKVMRWRAETRLQPLIEGKFFSRNQLLSEDLRWYLNRSRETTDILHEYFVPRATAEGFVKEMRSVVLEHEGDLLNVTVREVETDTDSFLRYADQPMTAFVMLFNQERSETGEQRMAAMTRALIDTALRHGGRYYLPYRLHATVAQFHRAYPRWREFFELKRRHDPDELFQNQFYVRYGR